jgi:hypothetical protein
VIYCEGLVPRIRYDCNLSRPVCAMLGWYVLEQIAPPITALLGSSTSFLPDAPSPSKAACQVSFGHNRIILWQAAKSQFDPQQTAIPI